MKNIFRKICQCCIEMDGLSCLNHETQSELQTTNSWLLLTMNRII